MAWIRSIKELLTQRSFEPLQLFRYVVPLFVITRTGKFFSSISISLQGESTQVHRRYMHSRQRPKLRSRYNRDTTVDYS